MLFHDSKNPNSYLTAIKRERVSYPTRILFQQEKIKGKVLDFGCGAGIIGAFVNKKQPKTVTEIDTLLSNDHFRKVDKKIVSLKQRMNKYPYIKEIEIGKEQARQEGKPEQILEKIAQGKLQKFFKENKRRL